MMRIKLFLSFTFIISTLICQAQINVNPYLNSISIESIQSHVYTLASDSMEGRNTGKLGQKKAARYIASEFSKYGLKPYNPESETPYDQEFNLYKFSAGETSIYYNNLVYKAPIYIGNKSISDSISGEVIFGGYANEIDFKNIDIKNKSLFFLSKSVKNAIAKAKEISTDYGVNTFIVGLPFGKKLNDEIFTETITDFESFKDLFYYYHYLISSNRTENDFNELMSHNKLIPNFKIDSEKDIRILFVPEELAAGLFWENFKDLKQIAKSTKKTTNQNLHLIHAANFSYRVNYNPQIDTLKTENIIGYIDSDLSNEKIIIGAHYDHIGQNPNLEINYGADDNASGTTGMLSIAKAMAQVAKDSVKLYKDIIFIAYSGEELGLHGSKYYVQNPLFPLAKTKVVFNLDMIGRDMNDAPENSNRVFLLQWKGGSKYTRNIKKLNKKHTNLIIDSSPGFKNRTLWTFGSDHYSFVQKQISSIAYFTGLHNDYHTPRDTPDKLNYSKMNRIIQLVFLNTLDITTKK